MEAESGVRIRCAVPAGTVLGFKEKPKPEQANWGHKQYRFGGAPNGSRWFPMNHESGGEQNQNSGRDNSLDFRILDQRPLYLYPCAKQPLMFGLVSRQMQRTPTICTGLIPNLGHIEESALFLDLGSMELGPLHSIYRSSS